MGDSWAGIRSSTADRIKWSDGDSGIRGGVGWYDFHTMKPVHHPVGRDAKALDRLKNVRTQQIEDELQNDLETCMRAGGRPGI
jgi:hypothetical protein